MSDENDGFVFYKAHDDAISHVEKNHFLYFKTTISKLLEMKILPRKTIYVNYNSIANKKELFHNYKYSHILNVLYNTCKSVFKSHNYLGIFREYESNDDMSHDLLRITSCMKSDRSYTELTNFRKIQKTTDSLPIPDDYPNLKTFYKKKYDDLIEYKTIFEDRIMDSYKMSFIDISTCRIKDSLNK
jgi:hypothetical protein